MKSNTLPIGAIILLTLTVFVNARTSPYFLEKNGGTVYSILEQNAGEMIVGGDFKHMGGTECNGLIRLQANGQPDPSFSNPFTKVSITAMAADSLNLYAAGSFWPTNGEPYYGVAKMDLETGALDESFSLTADSSIQSLVYYSGKLYIAGQFANLNSTYMYTFGRVDASSGAVDSGLTNQVRGGAVCCMCIDGDDLYLGGFINSYDSVSKQNIVKINANTAVADLSFTNISVGTVWSLTKYGSYLYAGESMKLHRIDATTGQYPSSGLTNLAVSPGTVYALRPYGDALYVGGSFSTIDGSANYQNIAKVNISSGGLNGFFTNRMNGTVYQLCVSGTNLYVGGSFTRAGGISRAGMALLETQKGNLNISYQTGCTVPGTAHAVALDDSTNVYVGGDFELVNGFARTNIVRLTPDGGVDESFECHADGTVYALACDGMDLYAGGYFNNVNGIARKKLARINMDGSVNTQFVCEVSSKIHALAIVGTSLFIGGEFYSVGGYSCRYLAKMNRFTGEVVADFPGASSYVYSLAADEEHTNLYAGGYFYTIGTFTNRGIACVNAETGDPRTQFSSPATGCVYALMLHSNQLYAGGSFTGIGSSDKRYVACLDPTTGVAVASFDDQAGGTVYSMTACGTNFFIGGTFTNAGGFGKKYAAQVNLQNGNVMSSWTNEPDYYVRALQCSGDHLFAAGDFEEVDNATAYGLCRFGPNTPPSVFIMHPLDESEYIQYEYIPFIGSANDADGDAISNFVWSSDLNGPFGYAAGVTNHSLTSGTHIITFSAVDALGATGSVSVSIEVFSSSLTNGLPDGWQIEYFSSIGGGGNAEADPDNDGADNFAEWLSGTDPADPASFFVLDIDLPEVIDDPITLQWEAVSNRVYNIYYTLDLMQEMQLLRSAIRPDQSGVCGYTDTDHQDAENVFYSIEVER